MVIQRRITRNAKNYKTMDTSRIPTHQPSDKKKIALIQPGSWGDNINSTLMLKPIKDKWPDSIIDVFTSTTYGNAFHNNPYINFLHEAPANSKQEALHQLVLYQDALKNRGYDLVLRPHPMVNPDKWTSIKTGQLGTNLICAFVRALEDADIPYTLPLETVLRLTPQEIDKVKQYCGTVNMNRKNILMETQGESGQTFWNHEWTMAVGDRLLQNPNVNLFISRRSTGDDVQALAKKAPGRVHFVGGLSLRECAELFNKCQAFFSVSSGLSNACNTNWCKKDIQWVETVNGDGHGGSVVHSAPIRSEGKIFWFNNDLRAFLRMLPENGIC